MSQKFVFFLTEFKVSEIYLKRLKSKSVCWKLESFSTTHLFFLTIFLRILRTRKVLIPFVLLQRFRFTFVIKLTVSRCVSSTCDRLMKSTSSSPRPPCVNSCLIYAGHPSLSMTLIDLLRATVQMPRHKLFSVNPGFKVVSRVL